MATHSTRRIIAEGCRKVLETMTTPAGFGDWQVLDANQQPPRSPTDIETSNAGPAGYLQWQVQGAQAPENTIGSGLAATGPGRVRYSIGVQLGAGDEWFDVADEWFRDLLAASTDTDFVVFDPDTPIDIGSINTGFGGEVTFELTATVVGDF